MKGNFQRDKKGSGSLSLVMTVVAGILFSTSAPARPLAQEHVVVAESPDPAAIAAYNPGLARLPGGRLIATYNLRRGYIATSDDRGQTWQARGNFPFRHARPFISGDIVYILGQAGDLMIVRSEDWGETWSDPVKLTGGQTWNHAPTNVHYANGNVYLVMERQDTPAGFTGWAVKHLAPVLMRAPVAADLTRRESWTFASELFFRDVFDPDKVRWFCAPFYPHHPDRQTVSANNRRMSPPGWLEANVVQITDPTHFWYDPEGRSFHLFLSANTGMTNNGALAKVVENADGSMTTLLERAPSGEEILFLPLPGGQMKFHIVRDDETGLYWLLSSQSSDSMTRPEHLGPDRFGLADNERHRLQLHFSTNAVDWMFAGMVAVGGTPRHARHYASMVIDGDDLHVLSRSGDENAQSAHNTNLITFHTVPDFRDLAY
jgi:hypothetical protein